VMDANSAPFGAGGGFAILSGSATIVASVISGNTGRTGGGIDARDGTLALTDTRVRGNAASYSGGGVYFSTFGTNDLLLNRVSVIGNSAGNNVGAGGGGIFFSGRYLYVTRSLISGNSANSIYNDGGGGIAVNGTPGALYVDYSTIYGNYAIVDAGGILGNGTKLTVRGSTIAGNNTGGYGPGNAIKAAGSANAIAGSIVANNFNRGGTSDLEGNFNAAYSLIKTPGAGALTLLGLGNIVDGTDPQLGPLAPNGGPTLTMLPAPGSIVINHGNPSIGSGTDQRGLPRVVNGRADIGSVERQYPEDVIFRYGFDLS